MAQVLNMHTQHKILCQLVDKALAQLNLSFIKYLLYQERCAEIRKA